MLQLIVVVALLLLIAGVIAATGVAAARRSAGRRTELDRFAAASALTNRWAADPESAPAPVLDIAAHGGRPVEEDRDS